MTEAQQNSSSGKGTHRPTTAADDAGRARGRLRPLLRDIVVETFISEVAFRLGVAWRRDHLVAIVRIRRFSPAPEPQGTRGASCAYWRACSPRRRAA